MKTNPNKLITINATFSGVLDNSLPDDIQSVQAHLFRGDNYITDLKVDEIEPLKWKVKHIFPKSSPLGDYTAKIEVKVKDQKEPIIQEEKITLVRDINLDVRTSVDEIPRSSHEEYKEVPQDIVAHLVNDFEN